jgi:hypothetical protein
MENLISMIIKILCVHSSISYEKIRTAVVMVIKIHRKIMPIMY